MNIFKDLGLFGGFNGLEELAPTFLWGAFLVLVIMASVLSYVFYYHFKTFGFQAFRIKKMALLYLAVCASLIITAYSSIQAYLNSL